MELFVIISSTLFITLSTEAFVPRSTLPFSSRYSSNRQLWSLRLQRDHSRGSLREVFSSRINNFRIQRRKALNSPFDRQDNLSQHATIRDYVSTMRPITIIQAVGAFLVGRLVILVQQSGGFNLTSELPTLISASFSIYLSYGVGMAMNDCADASVDLQHGAKQNRSIASGRVSVKNGWIFCAILSVISLVISKFVGLLCVLGNNGFLSWNVLNLLVMASYALGMQKLFLVKNLLCGWLAVSPLVGASLLGGGKFMRSESSMKLLQLAAIGFPLQVAREILKDIEDVDVDRGQKQTLPLLIGKRKSKLIAYSIVAIINFAMIFLPSYWQMFSSNPPVYALSVVVGVPMCIWASVLPLEKGQRLLKKSIYVLLAGMISGLLLQAK
mmetsp:Transcript_1857/g.3608  ORF Transcript_1857/g.3608 Transcript_1857/m.3608 type:complete len:384 (+) Transcript_1857:144-1295(+)